MQSLLKASFVSAMIAFSAQAVAADEITLAMDGIWDNETQITGNGFGYKEWNFWLDARVANLSYHKVVGVTWTDDGWATNQVTYLSYESTYPDGFEQWGADVTPAGQFNYTRYADPSWTNAQTGVTTENADVVVIEYALFFEVDGQTYWDNNNGENYRITIDSVSYNN